MAKLFAPILAFTCDEIWQAMPHRSGDDTRNILFNDMNKPFADYALDVETMAKWDTLIRVREDVNGVLEQARADKRIGKALEAQVCLSSADAAAEEALSCVSALDLAELFIVSAVTLGAAPADSNGVSAQGANFPGLRITVSEAEGVKCPRCWKHSTEADPETGLCPRCAAVVAKL